MTATEPRSARRAPSILRKSSAGYEFDENSDEWMLDGSITIKLTFLSKFGVEEKTAEGFRKSLSSYAQDLSSNHCQNISTRAAHFFKVTKFLTPTKIIVASIGERAVKGSLGYNGTKVPEPSQVGREQTVFVRNNGCKVILDSGVASSAYLWDGSPQWFNHMD